MSFHSIRKKLALFLLEHSEKEGNPFQLKLSITALAEYIGVERPSLSTVYNKMKEEGFFQQNGKTLLLTDRKRLLKELN